MSSKIEKPGKELYTVRVVQSCVISVRASSEEKMRACVEKAIETKREQMEWETHIYKSDTPTVKLPAPTKAIEIVIVEH